MITLVLTLIFLGNFALYNTSQKAPLQSNSIFEKWLQINPKNTKIIGIILLIIALVLSISLLGNTSGVLYLIVTLITILSLIIILTPLKLINYKGLIVIGLIILLIEIIL